MRRILGMLCLAVAAAGLPLTASADYLVDDFSVPQAGGTSQVIIDGEGEDVRRRTSSGTTIAGSRVFEPNNEFLVYNYGFGVPTPSTIDLTAQNFAILRDALFTVGSGDGVFTLTLSSDTGTTQSVSRTVPDGFSGDLLVDITSLSAAVLQNTERIRLGLSGAPGSTLSAGAFAFSPIPEPASMALMGMAVASAGGMGLVRRRRKKVEPIASA